MVPPILAPFVSMIADSQKRLAEQAAAGHRFMGYFCNYTPMEILDACGFAPIRISGGAGPAEKSGALIPDFICPFMKRSVESILAGEYAFLSGVIQGYGCDAACGVVNILENRMERKLFHSIPLPYNENPEARGFLRSALLDLVDKLTASGGIFSEARLGQSIRQRNRIRRQLELLHEMRYQRHLPISSADLFTIQQAKTVSTLADYEQLLDAFMAELSAFDPPDGGEGVPVLVSGSLIESVEVIACIEKSGGYIAGDDLCSGERGLSPPASDEKAPLEQIIDRHFDRIPCACRSRAEDRFLFLKRQVERSGARGVLFLLQKFCTPHLSDIPCLSGQLKEVGIPSLVVELDEQWKTAGAFQTRLDSFFEMLR